MASNAVSLPPGFELERDQSGSSLPPGFVLESGNTPQQQEPPLREQLAQGFGAAAANSLLNLGKIGSYLGGEWLGNKIGDIAGLPKLPEGVDPYKQVEQGIKPAQDRALSTTAGKVGAGVEGIAEFVLGDAALKGLGVAQKLGIAGKLAELAEKSPTIAKALDIGLNAVRTGAVGTGQAALQNDEHPITTGAITGVVGGLAEGGTTAALAALEKKAAARAAEVAAAKATPELADIAGETVAKAPSNVPAAKLAEFTSTQQQGAQKALANIAEDTADRVVSKFGADVPEGISTFGDASQAIKDAAQPVFKQLDQASAGEFTTARNQMAAAQKVMRRASSMEALQGAEKSYNDAAAKIDTIFSRADAAIKPADLANAKEAWKVSKTLDVLHSKLEAAFNVPQSAAQAGDITRTLDVNKIAPRLTAAFNRMPKADIEQALGKQGVKNLYELASLTSKADNAKQFLSVSSGLGSVLKDLGVGIGGQAVGEIAANYGAHTLGSVAGPAGMALAGAHFLYTHPKAGLVVAKMIRAGADTPLIQSTLNQLLQSKSEEEK